MCTRVRTHVRTHVTHTCNVHVLFSPRVRTVPAAVHSSKGPRDPDRYHGILGVYTCTYRSAITGIAIYGFSMLHARYALLVSRRACTHGFFLKQRPHHTRAHKTQNESHGNVTKSLCVPYIENRKTVAHFIFFKCWVPQFLLVQHG